MANVKGLQRAYKRIRGLAQKGGDVPTIERAIREEIARFGDDPMLISMLASMVERRAGSQAALELHIRAANAAPEVPNIVEDYAACQERLGNIEAASTARFSLFSKGIKSPEAMVSLGWTLLRARTTLTSDRVYTPADFYRLALAQSPNPSSIGMSLSDAMNLERMGNETRPIMKDTLVFDPAAGDCWYVLGCKAETGMSAVHRMLDRAIRLKGDPRAIALRAVSCGMGAASREELEAERRHIETSVEAVIARPDLRIDLIHNLGGFPYPLFYLAYHGLDDRPLLESIARMFRQLDPRLTWTAPHVERPRSDGAPISVAMIGSFGTLSIYLMMLLIANELDKERFKIKLYSTDVFQPETLANFPGIEAQMLPAAFNDGRQMIADGEHDIVFYTDLFMNPRYYFLAFARLARHQILWPGHPVTSGLDSVDYFVSTETLEREGSEVDYTEKLIKFPELCLIYPSIQPYFDATTTLESFGIEAGARVYMCAQTLFKIHYEFDKILADILRSDEKAVVILFENETKDTTSPLLPRIRALSEQFGKRVHLLGRVPLPRFLGLMTLVDVLLDTTHFSGGNTSFQAFQMGVPVVTLPGRFMRGRATYSLYRVMGFTDLVAQDEADYVRLALRVANDPEFRRQCVAGIEATRHRIFDRMDVAKTFERFFEDIVRKESDEGRAA